MKRFLLYIATILLTALSLSSCSEDTTESPEDPGNHSGNIQLRLSATPMSGADPLSRAETMEGEAGENIKSWFVIIVNNNKQIVQIVRSYDPETDPDSTEVSRYLNNRLASGDYTFYGFANIQPSDILGSGDNELKVGSTLSNGFDDQVYNFEGNKPLNVETEDAQSATQLFPNGIPMSCKQNITFSASTSNVTLNLVRMVAKIQVEVRNPTQEAVYVDRIQIRHITRDKSTVDNNSIVKLFPSVDEKTGLRKVNLRDFVEADSAKFQQTFVYRTPTNLKNAVSAEGTPQVYTFYVNESRVPDNNPFEIAIYRHTVGEDGKENASVGTYQEVDNWKTIGRNELHILSANLGRYRIDIRVFPYTAIGVWPSYNNNIEMLTLNLGMYGHYDIVPMIHDTQKPTDYYTQFNTPVEYGQQAQTEKVVIDADGTEHRTYQSGDNRDMVINSVELKTDEYADGDWTDSNGVEHLPTIGWNPTAMEPRIECVTGNVNGNAYVTITANVTFRNADLYKDASKDHPVTIDITRRMHIVNRYIDLSKLAKPRR